MKNNKTLIYLYKGKIVILTMLIVGLLIGFLYSYRSYQRKNYYEQSFSYFGGQLVSESKFFDEEIIKKTQGISTSYFTGSEITTYKYINIDESNMAITYNDNKYTIKIYINAITSSNVNDKAIKGFIQHLAIFALDDSYWEQDEIATGINKKGDEYDYHTICFDVFDYDSSSQAILHTDSNAKKLIPILSSITASIGLILGIITVLILGHKNPDLLNEHIVYDNIKLYKTPFHKEYWINASKSLKVVKNIVMISILLSMVMIAKLIALPSGFGSLGINFSYLFLSVASMLFGPIAALLTGFLSDTIGFIIKPDGMFFPGYTLSAMLACFTYAIFFYKTKITFTKCLLARVVVNFFVNAFLGSIWFMIYTDLSFKAGMDYMLFTSLPKNTVYLLPQSIVLFIVLKAVSPICHKAGYLDEEYLNAIKLF